MVKIGRSLFTLIVIIISSTKAEALATLGSNLLINHDFSTPNILPDGVPYKLVNSPILGWNCTTYC